MVARGSARPIFTSEVNMAPTSVMWLWASFLVLTTVVFIAAIVGSAGYRDRRWKH
jgi:hypothetical protein